MTGRSTEHTTLTIERHFKAPLPRVFGAWAVAENKRQWFSCHGEWTPLEYQLDFRPGGSESNRIASTDGVVHAYQARYIDIVPNERIIYAFDMMLDDKRISMSLATVAFAPESAGTRMLFTEQVVFLDCYGDNGSRLMGTEMGFDNLRLYVEGDETRPN
ncbi:SRPBCC family protein [Rhizobium rhizogenes]|uniref:Activator of Hsp90 ATPase homologue 1/2-like C-terminal domain-containing protein n=1 Tax=Rhizobium rhizogenes NBRC 13257 TaxID=1220581 RepID=A0AA87U2S2_RHIRH|nr:SRPBCC family protein [Rhizobium rhizogenes]KAA6489842.1 ATPase [Agrobacterium sp. ICMP 7243]NTF48738.1 ATPase [Rhizobium rhizogenes]NTF55420.1 ATPase [Rhizobium rhizogenes]NTF61791.1 ATPase [Rhizobium rhizogenes]NTF75000.1 ATPase [Rhizobium rhizogenes]